MSSESLTPSGLGRELSVDGDAAAVRAAALHTGLVLARRQEFDEESFRRFLEALGDTITYEDEAAAVGYGFSDVLHLDGNRDEGKVITGRGGLPLHTDGVLLGTQVDLIVLYAAQVRDLGGAGATMVCDQITAWREMPEHLREVLQRGHLEYTATERGYFTTVPEGRFAIPTFRDYGRIRSLNLALPFDDGADRSWTAHVPEVSEEESQRFFDDLAAFLSQDRYLYRHRWEEGDLVVIDNQRTLHGRRGLAPDGARVLLRGQVTLAPVEDAPGATTEGM